MGADSYDDVLGAADFAGITLSEAQKYGLETFHRWLSDEAIKAGGIGPHERGRLWNRHIADAILFGTVVAASGECLDIGTGVGLPGIPLAIAYPETTFLLVDRSGRRCDLARRAIAILKLSNCTVVHKDIDDIDGSYQAIVSRAAIPPADMMIHVKRLLRPGGAALLGLSRRGDTDMPVQDEPDFRVTVLSVPPKVLDSEINLLRIEAT